MRVILTSVSVSGQKFDEYCTCMRAMHASAAGVPSFFISTNSPEGRHSVGKSATHGSRLHLSTNGFSPLFLSLSRRAFPGIAPLKNDPYLSWQTTTTTPPSPYAAPPMFIFNHSLSIGDQVAVSVSIRLSPILLG